MAFHRLGDCGLKLAQLAHLGSDPATIRIIPGSCGCANVWRAPTERVAKRSCEHVRLGSGVRILPHALESPCIGRASAMLLTYIPPKPSGAGREAAGEILRLLLFMALKANVYVDAFNLYYGCIRKTPFHWLDLGRLCQFLLPKNHINRIRYFTALVTPNRGDPQQRTRQEIYLRALRTIPTLTIHTGSFLASRPMMRKADGSGYVRVLKSEEKGSDVNLASHLLIDAYRSDSDVVVIISNDSDLIFPIEHIKRWPDPKSWTG